MTESELTKVDDLISAFETAMLVTRSTEGKLRARPMAIARHESSPDVAVTMQKEGQYLSISGKARILTDQQLADELWSESMRIWFPDGPTDQQLTIILIEPQYAEFWDRTGLRQLELQK